MEFRSEEEDGPLPARVERLEPAERLLVVALRRWIVGWTSGDPRHWERVWDDFSRALGVQDGRGALTALSGLLSVLRGGARRPIRHHQPCCPMLHADEVALLGVVAAARHGEGAAVLRGSWLVRADARAPLAAHAAELGARLAAAGLVLPDRARMPAVVAAGGRAVVTGGAGGA
jgi:hypothetical protein